MARVEDMGLKSAVAGDTGRWPKLKLEPVPQKLWDETRAAVLWSVPSFSDIWYSLMVDRDGQQAWFTDKVETAATDDKFIYVNPNWFFKILLTNRIFVSCHEIMHAMFGHCGLFHMLEKQGYIRYSDGVTLPVDLQILNYAADYVINDQLIKAKIGEMPEGGLHWPDFISGDMGILDAYRKLWEREQRNKRRSRPKPGQGQPGQPGSQPTPPGQQPGEGDAPSPDIMRSTDDKRNDKGAGTGKPFDQHLRPGTGRGRPVEEAISERNESQWANTIAAAMASGELRGDMPSNLVRLFKARLEPKANWQDVYFAAVTRRVGNDRYSWEQLNPELIWRGIGAPGRMSYGCNLLIVAADSSGSITQKTLDVFLSESRGILETVRPRHIIFVQCDAMVHEWTEIDDVDDLMGKIKGGGGTDFRPVFKRIEKEGLEPDLLVYLTDMEGTFPSKAPNYPVVWGSILADKVAPFGEIVYIPQQSDSGE